MAFFRKAARVIAALLLLQPAAVPILAQDKKPVSLQALVDSSQHHLPELLQKLALAGASRAAVTDARHAYLPASIIGDQVSVGSDNSLPGSYFSLGVIPSTSAGVRSANDYQAAGGNIAFITNEYELFNFGLKKAVVNRAVSYANLSQADVERERYMLKWQVSKIYFDILKNSYQLSIDAQNIKRYEDIYRVIQAVTASGIRAGVDSSLALAELSKTRITYNQTAGRLAQQQQQLAYLTGIPAQHIMADTSSAKSYLSSLDALKPAADTAANPLTDYYARQEVLYRSTEELVRKSYLPKVLLTGIAWARGSSVGYDNSYKALSTGFGYQRYNYMAGLTVVYDLFNGIHRKDKLAISRLNTLAGNYALQQEQESLLNINNQAKTGINTAYKNLLEIPIQVKAAQDAFNQKTAQYKAGIINLVDLTDASFVLYRSQSDYIQTLGDWLLANLDNAASAGNLDFFIQAVNK